jgi:hypothetical protein
VIRQFWADVGIRPYKVYRYLLQGTIDFPLKKTAAEAAVF